MTEDLLAALQDANAYDAMPVRTQLHDLHVPFDRLVDGSEGGAGPWEGRLDAALRRGERVAVIGASGEGKSSLMQHVLGPLVEGLAPLPIAIGLEPPETVTEPRAFATHVVGRIRRFVDASLPAASGRLRGRSGGSTSLRMSLPSWLGSDIELSHELGSVLSETGPSAADHVETVCALLRVVQDAGLQPVLLLDDTDKWLRTGAGEADAGLREAFFGPVLRLVAEDMGCAAVIAVHPAYVDDDAYRAAATVLGSTVRLPRLPSRAALASVLTHREDVALEREPGSTGGWSSDGCGALFETYVRGLDLRRTVTVAHASLAQAVAEGTEKIEADHVRWACRELEL